MARKTNVVQTRTAFFYQSAWYVFINRQRTKLFDGTEKVLSWDNILWIQRSVLLP